MIRKSLLTLLPLLFYYQFATADGGFEMGLGLGYNLINTGQPGNQFSDNRAVDPDFYRYYDAANLQGGIHVSYYLPILNKLSLGLETGYQYLGGAKQYDSNHTGSSEDFNTNNIQAITTLFSMRYYLNSRIALFGKLGAAYEWFQLKHQVNGAVGPATASTAGFRSSETRYFFNPEWQLGALINISQHTNATLAFDSIMGQPGKDARPYVTNPAIMGVLAGLNWQQNSHDIVTANGPHPGGFEVAADMGYNRINTGQPGAQNSDDSGTGSFYKYYNYSNVQVGGHIGYYKQLYSRLLLGIETGYRYIGGTKLKSTATAGNSENFNTNDGQLVDTLLGLRFYVLHHLAILGKLGGAYTWYSLTHTTNGAGPDTLSAPGLHTSEYRSAFNPEWLLGLLVDFTKHLTASLAFDQVIGQPGKSSQFYVTNPTIMGVLGSINWDLKEQGNFVYTGHQRGGFEVGVNLGYNKFNTGQPGNQYTTTGAFGTTQRYYDYENLQYGGHIGYIFPITSRLLLSLMTGYQSLGSSKQSANNSAGKEHFNISSTNTINALLGLRFYLLNRLAIITRLGGAYEWIHQAHTCDGPGPITGCTSGASMTEIRRLFNPEWQVGILLNLTSHINATLAFNQIIGQPGKYVTPYIINPTIMGIQAGLNWDLQSQGISPITRKHRADFVFGVATGYNRINTGQPGNQASFDGSFATYYHYTNYGNAQGRVYLGYYLPLLKRVMIGAESGYNYLGGAKEIASGNNGSGQFKTQALQAVDLLIGTRVYITNRLAILAKLGGAYEWANFTHSVNGTDPATNAQNGFYSNETHTMINPEWQLGLLVNISAHVDGSIAFNQIMGQPGSDISPFVTNPTVMGVLAGINIRL